MAAAGTPYTSGSLVSDEFTEVAVSHCEVPGEAMMRGSGVRIEGTET